MILPFLDGIVKFWSAPITYLLILLNTLIFVFTYNDSQIVSREMRDYYKNEDLVKAQGQHFAQFIDTHSSDYSEFYLKLSRLALAGHDDQQVMLGRLAMRDLFFLKAGRELASTGDTVIKEYWNEKLDHLVQMMRRDPSVAWGLNGQDLHWSKWITYQFIHGGWMHLIVNMWFLLIFGCALETLIGSFAFLMLYLSSGVMGGVLYAYVSGLTLTPLVGASGAVSGLMAMYVGLKRVERVRFLYWILPIQGYTGFIFLPSWVLLATWLVPDIAGWLSTLDELGGVAHTAHLGGSIVGFLASLILFLGSKATSHRVFSNNPRL